MNYRRLWAGAVLSIALFGSALCLADVLILQNGDRLTGRLDSIQDGEVVFYSQYAGRVVVSLANIESLETNNVASVRLASGLRLNGRLVLVESGQALQTDTDTRQIKLAEVQRLAEDRIRPVDLGRNWHNRVDFNVSVASGNTDSTSVRARSESTVRRVESEHTFALMAHFEEVNAVTTRNQGRLGYDYRWFFRDDWYLLGNGEYFQDRVRDIDHRMSLGGGAGHRFWEDSLGKLSIEISAGATYEDLSLTQDTSPALRWALDYNRFFLGKRVELFHRNRLLKIFESGRGEILSFATGARYAMNDRWSANVVADVQHETRPQDGKSRTDVVYSFGVGVRF